MQGLELTIEQEALLERREYLIKESGYGGIFEGVPSLDPTKMSITTGSNGAIDDVYSFQIYNLNKNSWRAAAAPANPVSGMIWQDSGDDIARIYDGAAWIPIGRIVQVQIDINTTTSTKSTGFPNDDTKPQIGEGDEILSKAFTPIHAGSTLLFHVAANIFRSTGALNMLALFVGGTGDCLVAASAEGNSQGLIIYSVAAVTINARTYSVKVGSDTGNDCIVNDTIVGGVPKMGGSQESRLVITEVLP